jgi:hypothetical protein
MGYCLITWFISHFLGGKWTKMATRSDHDSLLIPQHSQDRAPDEPDMTPPEILTFVGMPADMIEARSFIFLGLKHAETDGNPPKKNHQNSSNK